MRTTLVLSVLISTLVACRTVPKPDDGLAGELGEGLDADADGDGVPAAEDCDDSDPATAPGAEELCDGIDNDCDGEVDEGVSSTWYTDADQDGFGDAANPIEACAEGEGRVANADDCDDGDPAVYPGALELCDGIDNNCDGATDDGEIYTWYADVDGDGFGDEGDTVESCAEESGRVLVGGDCDDTAATVHPEATELCNEADDDCDGETDEGVTSTFYRDEDGDGYGQLSATTEACEAPSGYADAPGDCDDTLAAVNPGATEVCNSVDDDCDGTVDGAGAADAQSWYADTDGDGFGDPGALQQACAAPAGTVADATDCNDSSAAVNPAAAEVCNGIDDDCDGATDDADSSLDTATATAFYTDADGDGHGAGSAVLACSAPSGTATTATDCDDSDAAVSPSATEICNSIDDDCDGAVDDADTSVDLSTGAAFYDDDDGDGYGDAAASTRACAAPTGTVSDATDCDDASAAVNPAASEVCNGIDDDCDSAIDDADASLDTTSASDWYADADADGYGAGAATRSCSAPTGAVASATDCDDASAAVNPGATEICNGIDDDCDSAIDDADGSLDTATASTFYDDDDGDGFGDASAARLACTSPSGAVTDATDCDDGAATVFPGATEACNLVDDDCDGTIDDGVMGSALACPAESCLDILVDQPAAASGSYAIDFDGTATTTTCDMATDGGGWTLVFSDDFEAAPDPGWSLSARYSCGAWSTLLGGYGNIAGGEIDILIDTMGVSHTEAWVELEYLALDSWDGERAYVTADGTTLFSRNQNNHSAAYSEVCGWNRGTVGSYDSSWTVDATLAHTAGDLELVAGSTLDQGATDESFGLDDVALWVR